MDLIGVRSYGKVVYVFGPVPILGFIIFLTKILGLFPLQSFQQWLHSQDWSAFIYNAKVRLLAATAHHQTLGDRKETKPTLL